MALPVKQCPWCGGTAFVVGYQHQEARIMTSPNGLLSGAAGCGISSARDVVPCC